MSFCKKNQKVFKIGKILKFDEETVFFLKKTLSSLQKASLKKLKGGKYAGASLPCFYFPTYDLYIIWEKDLLK